MPYVAHNIIGLLLMMRILLCSYTCTVQAVALMDILTPPPRTGCGVCSGASGVKAGRHPWGAPLANTHHLLSDQQGRQAYTNQ